jgi:antirestriction protein
VRLLHRSTKTARSLQRTQPDSESPGDFGIGEHESLGDLIAYAELLDEFETNVLQAAAAGVWSSSEGPEALRQCIERYRGVFDSPGEHAEELTSECQEIPDFLAPYLDWERMERDMELGGDITVVRGSDGRLYVFDDHG